MKELPWDNPEELSKLYNSLHTSTNIADYLTEQHFAVSERTIRRRLKKYNIHESRNSINSNTLRNYSSEQPTYDSFMNLNGDFAICSDIHIPSFDIDFFYRFLEISKLNKLTNCVIIGDLFDAKTLSNFPTNKREHHFEVELITAKALLSEMFTIFDDIYIIEGNHDARIARYLNYEVTLKWFLESCTLNPNLHFSDYHYCILNDNWRLTHPGNYSKIPGSIPRDIAETKHQNVICGHTHTVSYCWDKSGTYQCVECGGLFDANKTDYKMKIDKRFPEWQNGFCIMKDNKLTLFDRSNI